MGNCSVTLCCVAGGEAYIKYAEGLAYSSTYFQPSNDVRFMVIPGEEGWPNGTMYRWHRLLENMPETDYVFLCDADMRFESKIGTEIIGDSITLTLHPGYVGKRPTEYPYEKRMESACYVPHGNFYYCGGFAGGPRKDLKRFANGITSRIDFDVANGITPVWHDESALNKVADLWPDLHILDPSFCYPDDDTHYRDHIWKVPYQRKLVALDKKEAERGNR